LFQWSFTHMLLLIANPFYVMQSNEIVMIKESIGYG
jgi:hypothetical protein